MPELLTQERRLTEHQEVEKDYRWWKTSGLEWDWYINKDRGESDRMRAGTALPDLLAQKHPFPRTTEIDGTGL